MKTIEDMARAKLNVYLLGNSFVKGFPVDIAARKAAAANPSFAKEIYKIAAEISHSNKKDVQNENNNL